MVAEDVPLEPIIGERELVVAWLAQRELLPGKTDGGRYTLEGPDSSPTINPAAELLVVDNLGIDTDDDLEEVRARIRDHPRWPDDE